MGRNVWCLRSLLLASALVSGAAEAQSQAPTREQINPPPPAPATRGAVSVDANGAFARGPCPLDQSEVRAQIASVRFTGLNGAQLAPEIQRLLAGIKAPAGEQPIRVVCDIRDQANAVLRAARYVATIQIPPQRIEDGVLRLEVITGRIVQTRVRGDAGPYERLLEGRIRALEALDPLNEEDAERILLLADDVPGLDVQLSLQPAGAAPGDLIGELKVSFQRFQVLANANNYNSRQLGRETAYVRAEVNGLTRLGDLTYVALSSTLDFQEQWIAQAGHVTQLGNSGATFAIRGTYAESRPDLEQLSLLTRSWIASGELSYPLVRTVRRNANVALGYEQLDQRTVVPPATPLNRDRLREVYVRLEGRLRQPDFLNRDRYAAFGYVELRKGLDILNATKTGVPDAGGYFPSRIEGSATATIVRGELDTRVRLGPIFDFVGNYRGQWADKPLLNYDQFSIGNLTVGRGYDPGANTGDRAWGAAWELGANVPVGPGDRFGLRFFGFFDSVELWNLAHFSTEAHRVLQSVGGGLRLILPGTLQLEMTYAHPMDPPLRLGTSNNKAPDRVLVSLTTRFGPGIFR